MNSCLSTENTMINEKGGHQGLQSEMLSMISNSQLDAKKNTPLEEKELKKCKFVRTTEKGRLYLRLYPEAPSKGNNNLIAIKINHVYKIIDENGDLLANITWNLFSTQFKVEDKAGNELLSVTYTINLGGFSGPPKMKMTLNQGSGKPMRAKKESVAIETKQPEYSSVHNCYLLKFKGRSIRSSTKNTQLVYSEKEKNEESRNDILLQFAETGDNTYILDYKFPFTNLTAFAIGIIVNSSKFFCE